MPPGTPRAASWCRLRPGRPGGYFAKLGHHVVAVNIDPVLVPAASAAF